MAVLVTRPHPDNEVTSAALRAKGIDVLLAPMLRFEAVAFVDDADARYNGVIATSANALRALRSHPAKDRLLGLPLFAVGEHTADIARDVGFRDIVAGKDGASALPDLIDSYFKTKQTSKRKTSRQGIPRQGILLYLAGADIAHDLSGELGGRGFSIVTYTTYKMAPISGLPMEVRDAFATNSVEAILHYSRRSARAFIAAARAEGVEISALALPQCCISDAVAMILRDAGAGQVIVARSSDEKSMLDAVGRTLRVR